MYKCIGWACGCKTQNTAAAVAVAARRPTATACQRACSYSRYFTAPHLPTSISLLARLGGAAGGASAGGAAAGAARAALHHATTAAALLAGLVHAAAGAVLHMLAAAAHVRRLLQHVGGLAAAAGDGDALGLHLLHLLLGDAHLKVGGGAG